MSKVSVDKVIEAIRALHDHRGSSRQSVLKYCASELGIDAEAVKAGLKKGVQSGRLIQTGQSFKVKGDADYQEVCLVERWCAGRTGRVATGDAGRGVAPSGSWPRRSRIPPGKAACLSSLCVR